MRKVEGGKWKEESGKRKVEGGKWKEESGKRLEINNQQRIPPMHLDGILILSPKGVLWSILFPLSTFLFPLKPP